MKILKFILIDLLIMALFSCIVSATDLSIRDWLEPLDFFGWSSNSEADTETPSDTSNDAEEQNWRLVEKVEGCGDSISDAGAEILAKGGRFKVVIRPCETDECISLDLMCTSTNENTGAVTENHKLFYFSINDSDPTHSYTYEFEINPPEYVSYSNIRFSGMYDGFELFIYVLEE